MQRKSCVRWSCAVAAVPTITDSRLSLSKKSLDVTSRFFGKKVSRWSEKSPNLVTKSLNWQHSHLYFSPLSLYACSSTRVFKRTHVQEYLDHGQSEGGPPFTIADWFRPRYGPDVCLLLNHRETFRVAETFFFLNGWSHWCDLRFFLVAPLRN